jgi:putative glutamine amidotransferase
LHTRIHEQPGYSDHRGKLDRPFDEMYGPAHEIEFTPDSTFAKLIGKTKTTVNSLHWQGIDRVSDRLVVEGRAPDGVVEAVRVKDAGFALGAQWHPEFRATQNPDSLKLFQAFGAAARERARQRRARQAAAA